MSSDTPKPSTNETPSEKPSVKFTDLKLSSAIIDAVTELGYETPSPIQAQSIPHLLNGSDILGLAQTGTGKTAAFALPLLSRIDIKAKTPQILVLAPTRELAIQVAEAFQKYAKNIPGFKVLPIYGGQSFGVQLSQLRRGAQVIVGTPGRVMDHLRRETLKLDQIKALVLDEADEMLRMGFIDDVEWILEHTPSERQTALFSATMPKEIRRVCQNYLNNPEEVQIASKARTGDNIDQSYLLVSNNHKLDALTRVLEVEPVDAMIIFVRTKNATNELAEKLEARGYSAAALNGDMNQQHREQTIERLKNGSLDIAIATDVAARGIDVERVSHVLNYDIPYDSEAYVHRIGRTGRAGRSGRAILFVTPRERRLLKTIERATKKPLNAMEMPSGTAVTEQRVQQFKTKILSVIEGEQDLDYFHRLLEELSNESQVSPENISAALAYMLQKSRPLQYTPPEIPSFKDRGERKERGERRERGPRTSEGMQRYRLEVGRSHEVRPGDIVGAIANEAGIDSKHIGHIRLFDKFSTVELPDGMPSETLSQLQKVWVRGQQLNMKEDNFQGGNGGDYKGKGRGRPGGGNFKGKGNFKGSKKGGNFKPRKPKQD